MEPDDDESHEDESSGSEAEEAVGVAQHALVFNNEVKVNSLADGVNHTDVVGSWIRGADAGSSAVPGTALVAFTREESGNVVAATGFSNTWTTSTPGWVEKRSNDPVSPWPAPANLCTKYPTAAECIGGTGPSWAGRGGYDRPGAVTWTGLDDHAAVVTTGGFLGEDTDVFVVASTNGGSTISSSLAISLTATNGDATGGAIEPGSLHASLASWRERTTSQAGDTALPIYITWRSNITNGWYWTKVLISSGGGITQLGVPRRITPMDGLNARTRASIIGFRRAGVEKVAIFWGERTNPVINSCPGITNYFETATWKAVEVDVATSVWGCFKGTLGQTYTTCSGGKVTIATDTAWKPCVRPAHPLNGFFRAVNNLRPEAAMNAPASASNENADSPGKTWWYLALNKSVSGIQRVHLYRTGGLVGSPEYNSFQIAYQSPTTDPQGTGVLDSYGQSIYLHQSDATQPRIVATWRNALNNSLVLMSGVIARHHQNLGSMTFGSLALTQQVNTMIDEVPWPLGNQKPGVYTATFGYQRCDGFGSCPSQPISDAIVPFSAAWPDGRRKVQDAFDVYSRGLQP